ncbi:DUF2125 domain-containing protein [Tranquillimonas rosea]|uniref:DUF2125 domain-containing protein n=1 Tax=Tranquillimonas rosea TaxID=641238 RepID=UPI003BAC03F1
MRKVIVLALVLLALALLYAGYWFVGQAMVERKLATWFQERQAAGWVAEYDSLNTSGFPSRFDTTITDITLADPATGVAWDAPFFQILALSYKPNHVIVAFPHEQSIASPYDTVAVGTEQMRGSVVFRPGTALALDRMQFVLDGLTLDGSGWSAALDEGRFAVRQAPAQENAYEIGLDASQLVPSKQLRDALDPSGRLPEEVEVLRLDTIVGFDRQWDRTAIEDSRPQPTAIDLSELRAEWGGMELRAAGALDIDDEGRPSGKITVKAVNWREMLQVARQAGALPEGLSDTLERGLQLLAGMSGAKNTLDATLTFSEGAISFGPIPLGRVPPLTIR